MSTVTSRDGTTIGYDRTGSGPLLVIVTGATTFRAVDPSLAAYAANLAADFTVVTYDRRGRGESGDSQPYSAAREIEDIAALIAANGGRAFLLGFSSGSVLALEAVVAGLPVDKLIMYEPPFVLPGSNFPPPPADYVETLDRFAAAGDAGAAMAYFMSTVGASPADIDGFKQTPVWPLFASAGGSIRYDGRIMFEAYYTAGRFPDRWSKATVPVLVANGDASFPFMPMAADAVAAALPDATRATLPGQGHGPSPEVFAPVIRDFLGAQ